MVVNKYCDLEKKCLVNSQMVTINKDNIKIGHPPETIGNRI